VRILYLDIDTLRPDHLGCYGYHRSTSPNIDAIAERGVRFTNVYASDVPCLPSRTALVTGTFGIRNGVNNHGGAAADLVSRGRERSFFNQWVTSSFPAVLARAGLHTASISSFPLRHGATWWSAGFRESMDLAGGYGVERADEVLPGALDWLDRRGRAEDWFLHLHLWDPHTPHNAPESFGNPFADEPPPAWHDEAVRLHNWDLPGPHSAQEPWGFRPDEWGPPGPRSPWNLATDADVKQIFDGYDVGVRYADEAVGILANRLADLGVLDETAIWISSDHGEAFGELGVYADHLGADEATAHVPAILAWPGLEPSVQTGLHYHLDVAATIVELAGAKPPRDWDGQSRRDAIEATTDDAGRHHLVLTQGAWTAQRAVRTGDHLYLRTRHDGYHTAWPDEMLFDVAADPHEQVDLATADPTTTATLQGLHDEWVATELDRSYVDQDPLTTVVDEGGPFHVRGHLPAYLDRLRDTGRSHWIEPTLARHPLEGARRVR
jgi:arylsulfatase A-like enzyme